MLQKPRKIGFYKGKKRGAKKGHKKWGGRRKGGKNKKTILKEQMRATLEKLVGQEWEGLCLKMIRKARKSSRMMEFITNQMIGKPTETKKFTGNLTIGKILDELEGK